MTDELTEEGKPITLDDVTGLLIHSYNNYLSSMMGYAELALLECKDEKVEERLNKSLESGISAVHFGKTILASIGRLQVKRSEVNFNAWFTSFIELLQADFEDDELVVESSVPEDVEILTDFSWFTECCVDLIRFLLAFDAKADLTFSSEVERVDNEDIIFINININSKQIELDEKQQEYLFTPFYSSRILLGEKDIGLAKAHGFFEQIGTSLEWDNESGFTIKIPISSTS